MNELSRRLRALRIGAGMSQSEVGGQVGLSHSAVTQIESGNRDITAEELVRFSTAFGHSPVSLLSTVEHGADGSGDEMDAVLDDILRALPEQELELVEMRASLVRLVELARDGREPVAFISRLLVLATEARRRGALSASGVERIAGLSGLDEEERVRLLGTEDCVSTKGAEPG